MARGFVSQSEYDAASLFDPTFDAAAMKTKILESLATMPPRKACPVCGQPSYSLAGIHPQCAEYQNDEKRLKKLKAKKAEKVPIVDATPSAWRKPCPKCGVQVHVRKALCDCGHKFITQKTKSGMEG